MHRLAVLTSHPIQYQAPLWRKLAARPEVDLTVFFCSRQGLRDAVDPEFGVSFKWDIPLLDGYRHVFLRNLAPPGVRRGLLRLLNPGIVPALSGDRFDALFVHGYALATNWLAMGWARLSRLPLLLRGETVLHEEPSRLRWAVKRSVLRAFLGQVSACLPIGTRSAEFYRFFGVPESRLFLTPYAVDNDFFRDQAAYWESRRSQTRASLGIPESVPLILYAGKLTARKRPMDLLEAFARHDSGAFLLFVGDGALRAGLEERARELCVKNVAFTGFKNQRELPAYYAAADVFVLPSSFEPWGLGVNEAMCFALPIVTTSRVAAAADLVRSGENGFILQVGDVDALAAALGDLLSDPLSRRKMGRRSSELIAEWGIDQSVDGVVRALGVVADR